MQQYMHVFQHTILIQGWVLDLSCMQLRKASSRLAGSLGRVGSVRLAIVIGFILVSRPTNRLLLRVEALDLRNGGGKEKAQVTHRVVIDLRAHFDCIHRRFAPLYETWNSSAPWQESSPFSLDRVQRAVYQSWVWELDFYFQSSCSISEFFTTDKCSSWELNVFLFSFLF